MQIARLSARKTRRTMNPGVLYPCKSHRRIISFIQTLRAYQDPRLTILNLGSRVIGCALRRLPTEIASGVVIPNPMFEMFEMVRHRLPKDLLRGTVSMHVHWFQRAGIIPH